jgi:hypothetical protein
LIRLFLNFIFNANIYICEYPQNACILSILEVYPINNQVKTLPVKPPLVTSFGLYANKLSVLAAYPETWSWFFNNFILLRCGKESRLMFHDTIFRESPWTQNFALPRNMVTNWIQPISEFLIDCINQEYYIYLEVDKFFIANSSYFGKRHFTHDLFVYGYDRQAGTFNISGNLQEGKYVYTTCTFQEMDRAYKKSVIDVDKDWLGGIVLYKFKSEKNVRFDLARVKWLLQHYLNSTNAMEFSNHQFKIVKPANFSFGISTYDHLVRDLKSYTEINTMNIRPIDVRSYHVLYDHKKTMKARLEFMTNNGYMEPNNEHIEQYDKICTDSLVMRNLVVKYQVTQDIKIISKLITRLEQLKEHETKVLRKLIEELPLSPIEALDSTPLTD